MDWQDKPKGRFGKSHLKASAVLLTLLLPLLVFNNCTVEDVEEAAKKGDLQHMTDQQLTGSVNTAGALDMTDVVKPVQVSASAVYGSNPPENAADGRNDTQWVADDFSGWIRYDLGGLYDLSKIRFTVHQSPAGETTHLIRAGQTLGSMKRLANLSGRTKNGQFIELPFFARGVRYVEVKTVKSPSWVAWSNIQVLGTPLAKREVLRIPALSATASGTYLNYHPKNAIDGNESTSWIAPSHEASIQIDLGNNYDLTELRLNVNQSPSGKTLHHVYGGSSPSNLKLIGKINKYTSHGQWLELKAYRRNVRYLSIQTSPNSSSWVAWNEIEAYGTSTSSENILADCMKIDHSRLKHFGQFGAAFGGLNYISEVNDHSNLAWIADWGGDAANDLKKIKEAKSKGMKSILYVTGVFYENFRLRHDYAERWAAYANTIRGELAHVEAFSPMDEPFGNALVNGISEEEMYQSLVVATNLIRKTFPKISLNVIFAYGLVNQQLRIPPLYDWVGFDCYGDWNNCLYTNTSIPQYLEILKSRKAPHQKVFLVPNATLTNQKVTTAAQLELVKQAGQYYQLAISDKEVIGLHPFVWYTFKDHQNYTGMRDMPLVKQEYKAIGKCVSLK